MALEKEARTNIMGSSLDIRNRNWEKLDGAVIVESGSNENGDYVRFGDGTQICTQNTTVIDQAVGTIYGTSLYIGHRTWTFPKQFVNDYAVVHVPMFRYGTTASWGSCSSATSTTANLRIYDIAKRDAGTTVYIGLSAIGRWK